MEYEGRHVDNSTRHMLMDTVCRAGLSRLWEQNFAYAFSTHSLSAYLPDRDEWNYPVDKIATGSMTPKERDIEADNADMIIDGLSVPRQDEIVRLKLDFGVVEVRRPYASESRALIDWVAGEFGGGWASELGAALQNTPATAVIASFPRGTFATTNEHFVGFMTFDGLMRGFETAVGILKKYRGRQIALAIALKLIDLMVRNGYRYPIFGGTGPTLRRHFLSLLPTLHAIPGSEQSMFYRAIQC
ncbi:hypothetical protein [Pseudonocardia sp. HH130629-09]|uniref:hypothetical protein n=1 Tax=Pseudonocardia sp. HH130629-09 TaxID=1641402 RepID=UPI00143898BC|nr:hypothetical protein [Pseudonocardia sp. HH130629-09]